MPTSPASFDPVVAGRTVPSLRDERPHLGGVNGPVYAGRYGYAKVRLRFTHCALLFGSALKRVAALTLDA